MVLSEGAWLALIGCGMGLALAWVFARLVASAVFGATTLDPMGFAARSAATSRRRCRASTGDAATPLQQIVAAAASGALAAMMINRDLVEARTTEANGAAGA